MRPSLPLLASAMLASLAVAGLTGCGNTSSDNSSTVQAARRQELITADSLAGLKPGEHLVLDLRQEGVAYNFDFSKAPIDFSRITLLQKDGELQPMDKWLSAMKANGYDPLSARNHSFRVAPSAQSFGDLSTTEAAQLQSAGKLVQKTKGSITRSGIELTQNNVGAINSGGVVKQSLVCVTKWFCYPVCYQRPPYVPVCWEECDPYEECEEVEP